MGCGVESSGQSVPGYWETGTLRAVPFWLHSMVAATLPRREARGPCNTDPCLFSAQDRPFRFFGGVGPLAVVSVARFLVRQRAFLQHWPRAGLGGNSQPDPTGGFATSLGKVADGTR